MIIYFCVLFEGDGVKVRRRRIIRKCVGLERNTAEAGNGTEAQLVVRATDY